MLDGKKEGENIWSFGLDEDFEKESFPDHKTIHDKIDSLIFSNLDTCEKTELKTEISSIENEGPFDNTENDLLLNEKKKQKISSDESNDFPDNETDIELFGYENLGKRIIKFDESQNEVIYFVEEPTLTNYEEKRMQDLIHLFQLESDIDVSEMSVVEKKRYLLNLLEKIIKKHRFKISKISKNKIFYYLLREFIGFGKIDILMNEEEIEDISCDGVNIPIFIYHRKYESIKTNLKYSNKEELDSFTIKLAQLCGKQLSVYEPIVDGKLPDGSRLQTTLAKTVTNSSTFTIRRFREDPLTPVDLIKLHTMSIDMVAYFWLAMEHGTSMLFCGGTASGKTTLLNALSLFLPSTYKIVSIEDTREINLPHENWIAGTTREGFSTDTGGKTKKDIDMFDLIRAALRQRPRVIIVGEVRGKEAYTLFQAMATGHFSFSTMHAADINTLIQRLENPPISLPRTLMTSLDIVTFLTTFQRLDGSLERRVNSVTEIIKQEPESKRLIAVTPFTWNSSLNDKFTYHGGSKIFQKIMKKRGWNEKELNEEIANRKIILQWMMDYNIRTYKEVGRYISSYRKNAKKLLKEIKADAL